MNYISWNSISYYLSSFLDVLILSIIIYNILIFFSSKSLFRLLFFSIAIGLIYLISMLMHLLFISWLIEKLSVFLPFVLIILFQQEIKKFLLVAFAQNFFSKWFGRNEIAEKEYKQILNALDILSETKTGAIIILSRTSSLEFFKMNAIQLNADISTQLLVTIFTPPSPLHDGAIIIENNKIASAGVFVPITEKNTMLHLGSRHRAAIGMSEISDCLVITVSEETGALSLCVAGDIDYDLSLDFIYEKLLELIGTKEVGF